MHMRTLACTCSVENYEQEGVIFKGNVRGKSPEATYAKMKDRLKVGACLAYVLVPVCYATTRSQQARHARDGAVVTR